MEYFDLVDKNRIPLSKTLERSSGQVLEDGEYRQVVHVAIFNDKGKMLIQQRQANKIPHPNLWDFSVAGSVVSGETPCEAASRELLEELGIKYDFSKLRPSFTINFTQGFDDFFIINLNINMFELELQSDEVQQVKWASLDEILKMIEKGEFISYYKNIVGLLFEKRNYIFGVYKN